MKSKLSILSSLRLFESNLLPLHFYDISLPFLIGIKRSYPYDNLDAVRHLNND